MQVSGLGIGQTCSALVKDEGVTAFWKGLPFAYGRELSYTSIKLGAYAPVRDALGAGGDAPFYMKFLAGAITGGTGSGELWYWAKVFPLAAVLVVFLATRPSHRHLLLQYFIYISSRWESIRRHENPSPNQ